MSVLVSSSIRFEASPNTSSNFAPAVWNGRPVFALFFCTMGHLVSSRIRKHRDYGMDGGDGQLARTALGQGLGVSVQHSAFSNQQSAISTQHSAFSIQLPHSAFRRIWSSVKI